MPPSRPQISQQLTHRVASYDLMWGRDIIDQPLSPDLDLSLEIDTVRAAIQQFNFIQMKRKYEDVAEPSRLGRCGGGGRGRGRGRSEEASRDV